MKAALYVEDGVMEVILTPENEHETMVLKVAEAGPTLTIKRAASFVETRGGWYRPGDYQSRDSLYLIVRRAPPASAEQPEEAP